MTKITKEWAAETSKVLQHSAEGLLNAKEGGISDLVTEKSTKMAAGVTLMTIASMFGTSGTGKAISALAGAASKAAAVKWLGFGSTLAGSAIVIPAAIVGSGWLCWWMIKGAQRKPKDLTKTESALFHRLWASSSVMNNKAKGKVSELRLSPQEVSELRTLGADMQKYLRYGCRKSRHVRKRTEKNHEELSKLLDDI